MTANPDSKDGLTLHLAACLRLGPCRTRSRCAPAQQRLTDSPVCPGSPTESDNGDISRALLRTLLLSFITRAVTIKAQRRAYFLILSARKCPICNHPVWTRSSGQLRQHNLAAVVVQGSLDRAHHEAALLLLRSCAVAGRRAGSRSMTAFRHHTEMTRSIWVLHRTVSGRENLGRHEAFGGRRRGGLVGPILSPATGLLPRHQAIGRPTTIRRAVCLCRERPLARAS